MRKFNCQDDNFGEESDSFSDYKAKGQRHTGRKRKFRDKEEHTHKQPVLKQRNSREEVFKCRHCKSFVCPPEYGSHHRNHCPFCLFSRHVDEQIGDRRSTCGASMEAIGYFQRPDEEYVLVHRCLACGLERFNRIAADDNFELVLSLPALPPRTSREVKAQKLQEEVGNEPDMHQIA